MALYDVPLPPECVARTDELTRRPGRSPGEHIDTLLERVQISPKSRKVRRVYRYRRSRHIRSRIKYT